MLSRRSLGACALVVPGAPDVAMIAAMTPMKHFIATPLMLTSDGSDEVTPAA